MKAKGYENAYFGFSDESSEGNWKWVNGTSTSYTNWHSGEPSNQDGIEHYAMFYEKFQDGTWNDADGIIDAGCAYICEWDDPTDKISQGDSFTDQQLRIIAKDLGVPDDLNVEIRQSPKAYWEAAGLWDIYVEITHNGKLVASGSSMLKRERWDATFISILPSDTLFLQSFCKQCAVVPRTIFESDF